MIVELISIKPEWSKKLDKIVIRTNADGSNTVMTQPWSDWDPQLNDYTGFSIASGNFHSTSPKISLVPISLDQL